MADTASNNFSWKSLAFDIPAALVLMSKQLAAAFLQFVFSMSYAAGNKTESLIFMLPSLPNIHYNIGILPISVTLTVLVLG
jgi:hypothetical protein